MHFVLSVSVVSGGFISRRQAPPSRALLQAFICLVSFPLISENTNVVLEDFRETLEAGPVKTGFLLQMDVGTVVHCNWHQNVALVFAREAECELEPGLL